MIENYTDEPLSNSNLETCKNYVIEPMLLGLRKYKRKLWIQGNNYS